jgi:hypothetical protein
MVQMPGTANAKVAVPSSSVPLSDAPPAAALLSPDSDKLTDQAVLDYLNKKGLGSAALELQTLLKEKASTTSNAAELATERLKEEDAVARNQRSILAKSTGSGYGYDRDSAWPIAQWCVPDTGREDLLDLKKRPMGIEEARAYLDAFTSIQLWVLSLPDEDGRQFADNPVRRAQALVSEKSKEATLESVIQELIKKQPSGSTGADDVTYYNMPPSAKAELMAVTFALLVHTYCELLEVGMESTAHTLRDAFKPIYEPLYACEYRDLYQCTTVEDIIRLNTHNSQHMEPLSSLKAILIQVASYQQRREELMAQPAFSGNNASDPQQMAVKEQKIQEYDRNIAVLKQKYAELSQRASLALDKMHDLPFLRRARAVRWQLTMSACTYGMLSAFLNSRDESLLAMSSLLQTKCELHVEKRDPLPFTPACVFDESSDGLETFTMNLNNVDVNWAAPVPFRSGMQGEHLPFPKYHLDDEYEDEEQAAQDKKIVEFNRALLINGFRRLEALEKKRDYESMPNSLEIHPKRYMRLADPLEPSILLTTLTSSSGPIIRPKSFSTATRSPISVSSIWEESGVGLCCAKVSPPDGRRVAVGCDDSAIRIWNLMELGSEEPSAILLGHKNGFPVFELDWNRDGRTLLSGGGDGSVRLWDTMAVGPFGDIAHVADKSAAPETESI